MLAWLLSVLSGAAEAEGYLVLLRYTGLPKAARWLIRRKAGTVIMRDFAFFPNREQLVRHSPGLPHSFRGAKRVDALWVVGAEYTVSEDMGAVKRILLPDPNCPTLLAYADSVPEGSSIPARIQATIQRASEESETKVKYCDHFTGFSINLVDTNQPSGEWSARGEGGTFQSLLKNRQ